MIAGDGMDGHIKLYRKFLDWEWYQDINTKVLFIHMLLKANWKDGKFMGTTIPRGSFVSSIKNLASETGLTEREIRTGISHLKTTGEVTSRATNKYSVFTIKNYDLYQSDDRQDDTQETGERHSNDKRTTTIEERNKEIKKEDNIYSASGDRKQQASALFETLWKLYPHKKGKGQVSDTQKQKLLKVGEDELKRCIERYKDDLKRDASWRKPQNGSTFFNSGYVDYLDSNYTGGGGSGPVTGDGQQNTGGTQTYSDDYLEGAGEGFTGF